MMFSAPELLAILSAPALAAIGCWLTFYYWLRIKIGWRCWLVIGACLSVYLMPLLHEWLVAPFIVALAILLVAPAKEDAWKRVR
jgi:hypothetical protein